MLFAGMSIGIWLEHAIPGTSRLVWIILACAASSLAWIASRSDAGSVVSLLRLNWYTVAAALAISIGGIRAIQFDTPASNDVAHLLRSERQQDVQIFGSTLYTPGEKQGRARFEMQVDSVRLSGASAPVPASGRVYVSVGEVGTGEWIDWSRAGCRISISGTLREVRPPGNPADFNFRRFLLLKGVRSTIWVQDEASIHPLGPPESRPGGSALRPHRRPARPGHRRLFESPRRCDPARRITSSGDNGAGRLRHLARQGPRAPD